MLALLRFGAADTLGNQLVRILSSAPAQYFHPFSRLEVFVVLEEMLDLLQRDLGQVAVGPHFVITLRQLR
jgi:hypothetical protein